jgi:hypothetical protein
MGYAQTRMITFSPRVLQWIPAACVVLIFIVQFFPWVGVYPGGVAAAWQGAWGIAFAAYGEEKDMDSVFRFTTDADLTKSKDAKDDEKVKDNRPGVGVLMIFYLLPFFFVTLIVTVGVVVVTVVPIVLPPSLEQWMTMRWTIVTGLNAVTFLFLVLQLLLGFPLENTLKEWQADRLEREEKARKDGDVKPPKVVQEARRGVFNQSLHRTFWLYAAVDLHLLAIAAAVMMASMEKRGNRPPPRLVLET